MTPSRSVGSILLWLALLFLLGAAVTAGVFFVFVAGPDRHITFYVVLSLVIAAEFVFFAHLAHSKLAHAGISTASTPVRFQVHSGILIWFILTVVAASYATSPERADTFTSDKILVIYAALTFVFFLFSYFMYSRSMETEKLDRGVIEEKARIQAHVPDVSEALRAVQEAGRRFPEHALIADKTTKKVDIARTAIQSAVVSERAQTNGLKADEWLQQVEQNVVQLNDISKELAAIPSEQLPDLLNRVAEHSDAILAALRRREQSLFS